MDGENFIEVLHKRSIMARTPFIKKLSVFVVLLDTYGFFLSIPYIKAKEVVFFVVYKEGRQTQTEGLRIPRSPAPQSTETLPRLP